MIQLEQQQHEEFAGGRVGDVVAYTNYLYPARWAGSTQKNDRIQAKYSNRNRENIQHNLGKLSNEKKRKYFGTPQPPPSFHFCKKL